MKRLYSDMFTALYAKHELRQHELAKNGEKKKRNRKYS